MYSRELVEARIKTGENQLIDLPQGMKEYTITLSGDAVVSDADIKAIAQWLGKAKRVHVKGTGNVAYRLSQQLGEMTGFGNTEVVLTVDRQSYKQLNASPFLIDRFSRVVFMAADDMPQSEFDEFVKNQKENDRFQMSTYKGQLTFKHM